MYLIPRSLLNFQSEPPRDRRLKSGLNVLFTWKPRARRVLEQVSRLSSILFCSKFMFFLFPFYFAAQHWRKTIIIEINLAQSEFFLFSRAWKPAGKLFFLLSFVLFVYVDERVPKSAADNVTLPVLSPRMTHRFVAGWFACVIRGFSCRCRVAARALDSRESLVV